MYTFKESNSEKRSFKQAAWGGAVLLYKQKRKRRNGIFLSKRNTKKEFDCTDSYMYIMPKKEKK